MFNLISDSAQLAHIFSHKINIAKGSTTYTYLYEQESNESPAFDRLKHRDLVGVMHETGQKLKPGESESFTIGAKRNYFLERRSDREFVITSLDQNRRVQ